MKKKILYVVLLLLAVVPFVSTKALDMAPPRTLDTDEYFRSDDNVSSSKEVNHSYFITGDKITSNDKVSGLLFMAGNALKAKSVLEYGLMAGNIVEVTGIVEKDLFIAGNNVSIEEEASIGRDLFVAGNSVTIDSNIAGNIFITCSTVEFNDVTLNGDITLDCKDISFGDNVTLNGTLKYNEGANVEGLSNDVRVQTYEVEEVELPTFKENLSSKLFSTISLLTVCIIIAALFPNIYKKLSKEITVSRVFKKMLYGLCVLVVLPVAAILILITVIGIPVSIISLLLYGICIYLSIAVTSAVIGNLVLTKLFKAKDNMYLSVIIGIVLVKLFSLIPYIGGITYFLLMLIGLGLILELLRK